MFSSPIGMLSINAEVVRESDACQSRSSMDATVTALGKRLHSFDNNRSPKAARSHTFSPLRFLWWASLLFGARAQQTTPFNASMELSALNGVDGFVLNGEQSNDFSGRSLANAGDVNGDNITDLVIGAYGAASSGKFNAGKSYVVFGRFGFGGNGSLELSSLNGTNGFVVNGEVASDESGLSVADAGDVNGDGINDLVIGAERAGLSSKPQAGKSYVIFGRVGLGSNGSFELSSLNGINGFVLNGEQGGDNSGWSVASAGDVRRWNR